MNRRFAMSLLIVLMSVGSLRAQIMRPPLPDFGVMNNNDGDFMYPSADPATTTSFLNGRIDTLIGTPAKTFMLSIGSGSDVLHYPTQVASNFGWHTTSVDNTAAWTARVNYGSHYAEIGYDPFRVVAERVKANGMYFIPSYRMNDAHFVVTPLDYPLTGEFWINNQDKTIGSSPVAGYDYSNLLDFGRQEVRDFRLAVINESIDRYKDVMDGYELDFDRFQIFFKPGEAQTNAHLMTDLVGQVRQKLDAVATETGRPQYLFVRVPPTLASNHWSGLEIENWMQQRLVDVVVPSSQQTLSHDSPIDEFVDVAHPAGAQVIPGILPRTNYGWDFVARPDGVGYTGTFNGRVAEAALTIGAASNYRYLGADGFQLYNHSLPWTTDWQAAATAMASENPSLGRDRIFAVTPAYFNDDENTYENAKQVPYSTPAGGTKEFNLLVGDDILQMIKERPKSVILRLGLTGTTSSTPATISINGHQLHAGSMASGYYTLPGAVTTTDGATAYFQATVGDLLALQQGNNAITVRNTSGSAALRITDIELGVFDVTTPNPAGPPTVVREPGRGEVKQMYYDGQGPTMAFTVTDRPNNGLQTGLGGVYFSGQASSTTAAYNFAAGFVFDQAMYYPSAEGALESLDYRYFVAKTSGTRPTATVRLLVEQDGKYFALNNSTTFENGASPTSLIVADAGVTAEDFWEESAGGNGLVLNSQSHPDFSDAGSPLFFGWMLSRSANPAVGGNDQPRTDLDDLVLTFHQFAAADFNRSGEVDAADLSIWAGNFGALMGAGPIQGDADGDGAVGGTDLLMWQRQFGTLAGVAAVSSLSTTVPEPAAMVQLLIATLIARLSFGFRQCPSFGDARVPIKQD